MGLDMYMYRKNYIGNKYKDDKDKVQISDKKINEDKIAYITEEIGDWRKFNALHGWMVEHVQDGNDDCKTYRVDREQLEELLDIIHQIQDDHKLAPKLLPTYSGFFFGTYEYDDYYFEDIDHTEKILLEALKEPGCDIEYSSSW